MRQHNKQSNTVITYAPPSISSSRFCFVKIRSTCVTNKHYAQVTLSGGTSRSGPGSCSFVFLLPRLLGFRLVLFLPSSGISFTCLPSFAQFSFLVILLSFARTLTFIFFLVFSFLSFIRLFIPLSVPHFLEHYFEMFSSLHCLEFGSVDTYVFLRFSFFDLFSFLMPFRLLFLLPFFAQDSRFMAMSFLLWLLSYFFLFSLLQFLCFEIIFFVRVILHSIFFLTRFTHCLIFFLLLLSCFFFLLSSLQFTLSVC